MKGLCVGTFERMPDDTCVSSSGVMGALRGLRYNRAMNRSMR
jgi:hypothetical protein